MFRPRWGEICLAAFGILLLTEIAAILMFQAAYTDETPADGWYETNGKYVYFEDGALVRNRVKQIDGLYYAFLENGEMLDNDHDACVLGMDGTEGWYRAMEGGELYMGEWVTILSEGQRQRYYYGSSGKAVTGATWIGDEFYLFGSKGDLRCLSEIVIDGEKWVSDEYGYLTKALGQTDGENGQQTGGNDGDGNQTGGDDGDGNQTGGNDGDGNQTNTGSGDPPSMTGWVQMEDTTLVYYLDGVMLCSVITSIEEKYYCFLDSGRPLCGESLSIPLPDGSGYRFVRARVDGSLYRSEFYLDPGTQEEYYYGADCFAATGLCTLPDGICYLFDQSGRLLRGLHFIYNALHLCATDGPYIGVIQREGWNEIDGERYYLFNGNMMTPGRHTVDWQFCYFDENGMLLHDCLCGDELLDSEGHIIQEGWATYPEGKYYVDPDTHLIVRSGEVSIENKSYYFDSDGLMVTGEVTVDGELRHYGDDGARITESETENRADSETEEPDPDAAYRPENEQDPAATDSSPTYTPSTGPGGRTTTGVPTTTTSGATVTSGADRRISDADSDTENKAGSGEEIRSSGGTGHPADRYAAGLYILRGDVWVRIPSPYLHIFASPNCPPRVLSPSASLPPGSVYILRPAS